MSFYTCVRYGKMFMVGRFRTDRLDLRVGDRCIVRTDRGKELGVVLTRLEPVPEGMPPESMGEVLRRAEQSDLGNAERLEKENVPRARRFFKDQVKRLNLPMKLVDVDYVIGGERIIFYFASETRVDFRELVRILAHEFRTRIELKQVGARDEARLAGDAGHCGLALCCRGFLKDLGGISMDMAKVQKHTADPAKITGRCGKLMCCLRGEYPLYCEARRMLPPKGTRVQTAQGGGVVVEQSLLLRKVVVEGDWGGRRVVGADEISKVPSEVQQAPESVPEEAQPAAVENEAKTETIAVAEPPPAAETPPPQAPPPRAPEKPREARPQRGRRPYWMRLGRADEFPPGEARVVETGGPALAVFNLDGRFHVLANACPHEGGPLGEGKVEGTVVTCPAHQWKFDIPTGKGLSVPGPCARRYNSTVRGGDLYVAI